MGVGEESHKGLSLLRCTRRGELGCGEQMGVHTCLHLKSDPSCPDFY